MNPKSKALALATMAVVGCTPTRSELRRDALLPSLGLESEAEARGRLIVPKRCDLTMATLARPLNDPALNEALWSVADEQSLEPEVRRMLEANGLRLGLVAGSLPREVEAVLNAPPPDRVEPSHIQIYSGENTLYTLCPPTPRIALMLNRGDKVGGKDYADASGYLRLTASHDGPAGVALRVVPEIHHGPIQHGFTADASASPFSVPQFVMHDGQQEDTLRELTVGLGLEPGQMVVVGCLPDRERSLGHFLFTAPEANSDRLLQKVVLIRADQSSSETIAPGPGPLARAGSSPVGADPAAIGPNESGLARLAGLPRRGPAR